MPDGNPTVPHSVPVLQNDAGVSDSDFDKLVLEAQQSAQTPVVDHPKPCQHAYDPVVHLKCPTCLWSFCSLCASTLDPKYCHLCLSEPSAELTQSPLTDVDGVTHDGRVLTPAAGATFFSPRIDINGVTLCKTISNMSDPELEDYIGHYKQLVQQAEKALDFRRVVLGTSQLELSQRKDAQQRKLRSDKTKYPVRTVTVDKVTGKQKTVTASANALTQMMQALEALQKLKKVQAASTPTPAKPEVKS